MSQLPITIELIAKEEENDCFLSISRKMDVIFHKEHKRKGRKQYGWMVRKDFVEKKILF